MATIQTMRVMPALVFTAVLLSTPAWADLGSRSGDPSIQSHQPATSHEDQPHGAQSTPTYRGGLTVDWLKTGDLKLKSLGGGMDGPRTSGNAQATFNSIRPDERQEHDVRGSGVPLWRW